MADLTQFSITDGLARITLDRPEKLNAISLASFREIDAHLDRITPDTVGCVLLDAAGRSFCAGHDLDDIAGGSEDNAAGRFETGVIERLATLPMPVVAAVQGHCMTGGLELVLAADIIIAGEGAKFADTHAKWDLVPIWGLSQRLPRRIGPARADEMMYASRTYSGAEAAAMGLANLCVADDALAAEAERMCADILANSWRATRAMKALRRETDGMTLTGGIAWEMHHTAGRGPEMADRLARLRRK
ncbi:enoyl-CoA hydratase/isomerase family protein [Sphingomonas immobilis]|uniref:Enoyl-CoA hydratase/isomerase family protein n=1 Tax=Sphingomonas immobilis TaxID=3063997 RepID=A0ABT8ZXM9_9SPHN|nr:enoyl-CoA hydratase/isomerase family protein [Sphingomonas sp. CA1-15]MDO7842321.1 enoyl-CoA hydratase/isomerase family protein [Sphingomonas sp. CA1-15]